jgi:hypothetical protein
MERYGHIVPVRVAGSKGLAHRYGTGEYHFREFVPFMTAQRLKTHAVPQKVIFLTIMTVTAVEYLDHYFCQ